MVLLTILIYHNNPYFYNLDFKKLAEIAFKNKKNQKILNGIIWPEVAMLITIALENAKKEKY